MAAKSKMAAKIQDPAGSGQWFWLILGFGMTSFLKSKMAAKFGMTSFLKSKMAATIN
jgi:hypothetical protein